MSRAGWGLGALLLGASVAVASARAVPAVEPTCRPETDRIVCADGRTFAIRDAADGFRAPAGRAQGRRGPWGPEETSPRGLAAGEDAPVVVGPDGLVCWPHGDHYHCRR